MVIIGEWSFYNNLRISCQCTLSRKLLNHLVTAVTRVFSVFGTGICTEATEQSSKSTQNVHDNIINHDIYMTLCVWLYLQSINWIFKQIFIEFLKHTHDLKICFQPVSNAFLKALYACNRNDHIMHALWCRVYIQ